MLTEETDMTEADKRYIRRLEERLNRDREFGLLRMDYREVRKARLRPGLVALRKSSAPGALDFITIVINEHQKDIGTGISVEQALDSHSEEVVARCCIQRDYWVVEHPGEKE
jgi:hypothetical protein